MDYTKKLLEVRDLHKAYSKEGVPTKALNGITFDVLSGKYLGIMGASGSGKTTLLNCIATVIKPTSGQILLSGANISAFDGAKLAEYRGNRIGYLFQDFALLDNLTGRENILLPLSIHNIDSSIAEKHLNDIAGFLGITDVLSILLSRGLWVRIPRGAQVRSPGSRWFSGLFHLFRDEVSALQYGTHHIAHPLSLTNRNFGRLFRDVRRKVWKIRRFIPPTALCGTTFRSQS